MKRFFITTLLILAFGSMSESFAQIKKNTMIASGSVEDHDPHLRKYPFNQEPTRTLDDYYNNNQQSNGKNNQSSSAHSGSSHNARSSNNNPSNKNYTPHSGTSNRSTRNSIHR